MNGTAGAAAAAAAPRAAAASSCGHTHSAKARFFSLISKKRNAVSDGTVAEAVPLVALAEQEREAAALRSIPLRPTVAAKPESSGGRKTRVFDGSFFLQGRVYRNAARGEAGGGATRRGFFAGEAKALPSAGQPRLLALREKPVASLVGPNRGVWTAHTACSAGA